MEIKMQLKPDEEAIIINFRKLSEKQKKVVLQSQYSFENWLKSAVAWVWQAIVDSGIHEIVSEIFKYFKKLFF
jgi:hypothetical protein